LISTKEENQKLKLTDSGPNIDISVALKRT